MTIAPDHVTTSPDLFADPRIVTRVEDCYFYHSMSLPGYGDVEGDWDLRGGEVAYLGAIPLKDQRVLEIGPGSGHLSFYLEQHGADVVCFDLSPEHAVDAVPFARSDYPRVIEEARRHVWRQNNSYWLAHRAFESRARMIFGTVYELPDEIGTFDIATFGCVLLHLRDPFIALQNVLAHTRNTVVVTDVAEARAYGLLARGDRLGRAVFFRPTAKACAPPMTWWRLTPRVVATMLGVLGFEDTEVTHHVQRFQGRRRRLFTVVGRRTHATHAPPPRLTQPYTPPDDEDGSSQARSA